MNTSKIIGLVFVGLVLVGGALVYTQQDELQGEPVACTMEAKLCPDGSSVGRTGPNCEFAACPAKPAGSVSGDAQFTGTVVTGASQGSIKQHCAAGLYLALDAGIQMNAQQALWLLKDSQGQMITDQQYVNQRVTITGTYPEANKLRCDALICGCEEYLTVQTIVRSS